jgi:protein gp37
MGDQTGIGWTQRTWNPVIGCTQIDPGCDNCYMARWATRFGRDPWTLTRAAPATFNAPLKWDREGESLVFTCSLSDWFHKDADAHRAAMWAIIRRTQRTTYQILTKRHGRIAAHLPPDWGQGWPNVWLGVSGSEPEGVRRRLDALRQVPAAVRFLSLEPQIAPVDLTGQLDGVSWVICGGESVGKGQTARPFHEEWALSVIEACRAQGVACYIKQVGAITIPLEGGVRLVHSDQLAHVRPELDVREWPKAAPPAQGALPQP